MMVDEPQAVGRSLPEVLGRRSTVAAVTFVVVLIALGLFVVVHKFKYGALSHVVLVNDSTGRDPSIAAVDMPTIVTGSTVLDQVRRKLDLSDDINDLRKAVNARVAPKSSLMTIAVEDHDPKKAVKITNTIADTFAKLYWNLASSRYDEVTRRLSQNVADAHERVSSIERRLEAASSGVAYVGSQASLDASAAHLGELEESRGVAYGQYITDHANVQADLAAPAKLAREVRFEMLRNNAAYNQTDQLVGKDVAQYTTTRAGVTEIYPGIAGFKDKVANEDAMLAVLRTKVLDGPDAYSPSEAGQVVKTSVDQAALAGDQVKLAAYDEQIKALKDRLSNPAADAPSMGTLRAERDTAEAQLQALSLALSNAQASAAEARSLGEVVVVDRATEARPTLVGPVLLFALGVVAAILLAIAAAYIAEGMIPRLLGAGDIERVYGRPVMATLRAR